MSAAAAGGGENGVARNTEKKTKDLTLVFCRKKSDLTPSGTAGNEILLGLKKRGFGEGKWNGEPSLPSGWVHRSIRRSFQGCAFYVTYIYIRAILQILQIDQRTQVGDMYKYSAARIPSDSYEFHFCFLRRDRLRGCTTAVDGRCSSKTPTHGIYRSRSRQSCNASYIQ